MNMSLSMMHRTGSLPLWIIAATLGLHCSLRAEPPALLLSASHDPVQPRAETRVTLSALNTSSTPAEFRFPDTLEAILTWPGGQSGQTLTRATSPESGGTTTIPAGNFAQRFYHVQVPHRARGTLAIEIREIPGSRAILQIQEPPPTDEKSEIAPPKDSTAEDEPRATSHDDPDPDTFFHRHFSAYEPMYFIAGSESPNAKFQISFKYQLVNTDSRFAAWAPSLKRVYVGYTQTSLWDLNQPSAPFLDSSYKPELLYSHQSLDRGQWAHWLRLDLQTGAQHESNGRDGDASRSLNIAYLRPSLTFGYTNRIQLKLEPRLWAYLGGVEPSNLREYRGYGDLRATVGQQNGLQLAATIRAGEGIDNFAYQFDASYPMRRLFGGSLSFYLYAQYFTGYGESLLLYDERDSKFRAGFSLYR